MTLTSELFDRGTVWAQGKALDEKDKVIQLLSDELRRL